MQLRWKGLRGAAKPLISSERAVPPLVRWMGSQGYSQSITMMGLEALNRTAQTRLTGLDLVESDGSNNPGPSLCSS